MLICCFPQKTRRLNESDWLLYKKLNIKIIHFWRESQININISTIFTNFYLSLSLQNSRIIGLN